MVLSVRPLITFNAKYSPCSLDENNVTVDGVSTNPITSNERPGEDAVGKHGTV